jgi:hypothetical protein
MRRVGRVLAARPARRDASLKQLQSDYSLLLRTLAVSLLGLVILLSFPGWQKVNLLSMIRKGTK